MEEKNLGNAIERIRSKNKKKSEIQKLYAIIDDIDAELKSGSTRAEIYQELVKDGLQLTEGSFNTALYRIRKNLRGKAVERQKEDSKNTKKKESLEGKPKPEVNTKSNSGKKDHSIRKLEPPKKAKFSFTPNDINPDDLV